MFKVYEFKEDKIVGAFIDGIPEAVRFSEGQSIRGRLVKTDNITRVYVITKPSGDMYSLPVDSVRVDQSPQGTA